MISGIFHSGSGVGNQLHRYVATRVLALDKDYDFSMVAPENCKVKSFMKLDMGKEFDIPYKTEPNTGKVSTNSNMKLLEYGFKTTFPWEEKTNYYNPEFNFIEDNTIIDGEFQDLRYFEHRLDEIDGWLCSHGRRYADNEGVCVIGFRGGEFYVFPELGLPKSYYDEGIRMMREINPKMKFEVQTDDPKLAREFFPDFEIVHNVEENWSKIRCYRYSIIANSSFYILPRLLKHNDTYPKDYNKGKNLSVTIAPRYWARRNTQEWSMPQNYYPQFTYI